MVYRTLAVPWQPDPASELFLRGQRYKGKVNRMTSERFALLRHHNRPEREVKANGE